jgi:thiamine pyrophosphokinase
MPSLWQPHLPTAYVAASGDLGDLKFLKSVDRTAAHIIGIDGGADRLAAAGIIPDAVLGDMDSVHGEFTNLVRLPDQHQSDLEKAIVYLLAGGVRHLIIYGAVGGTRLDHHIANLDLLTKYAPHCRITLVSGQTTLDGLSPENTAPSGLNLPVKPHSILGVLPGGSAATVTLSGTQYELNHATLDVGTHGVGNTAMGDKLHIQIHGGLVRLIRTLPEE